MVTETLRVTGTTGVLDYRNLLRDVTGETAQDAREIPLMLTPALQAGAQELRWFEENREKLAGYAGHWIAILGDRIVGSEPTFEETYDKVQEQGFADVLILCVPDDVGEWDQLLA